MQAKKAIGWFRSLSAFQHAAVAVLLPLGALMLLFLLFENSVVPSEYVAVVSFVSFGLLIPCAVIYVLAIYITEED